MNDFQKGNTLPPVAISTNWANLCMEALKNSFASERKKNVAVRSPLPFGYGEFKTLFVQSARIILERRRERNSFVIDDINEPVIAQLYLYLKMDDRFTLCSENQYGKMTGDKMMSMFNFIELKGDSRRK